MFEDELLTTVVLVAVLAFVVAEEKTELAVGNGRGDPRSMSAKVVVRLTLATTAVLVVAVERNLSNALEFAFYKHAS